MLPVDFSFDEWWETDLRNKSSFYARYVKRFLDIFLALVLIILLSPVMLLITVVILIDSGRPVIFRQERIGYHGRVFQMYKFRSMILDAEHTGSGVYSEKGDERVTRAGRILRATSLDELPQLFNILIGDMSLIGPRPPLTYHPWPYDHYTKEQLHMFDARPGITGLAQIHGRKSVEWHTRIKLNNWYVDHISFLLDLKILFISFYKVISCQDNFNQGSTVTKEN